MLPATKRIGQLDNITSQNNIYYLLLLYCLICGVVCPWTDLWTDLCLVESAHPIPNISVWLLVKRFR